MALLFSMIASFFQAISDVFTAREVDLPFKVAYTRLRHLQNGHTFSKDAEEIDKFYSENHPHSSEEMIYTVRLVKCECGLIHQEVGLEFRDRSWITGK